MSVYCTEPKIIIMNTYSSRKRKVEGDYGLVSTQNQRMGLYLIHTQTNNTGRNLT